MKMQNIPSCEQQVTRLYNSNIDIDPTQIRDFFDERARKESNAVNAVMLQSEGSTIARDRDIRERNELLPTLSSPSRILDLGCGAGRLALHYAKAGHTYLGLDFSSELIVRARELCKGLENVYFQVAQIPELPENGLKVKSPFDLVTIAGLLMYLNDEAVRKTLEFIVKHSAPRAKLYIRESVSDVDQRLTLKNFYSEELEGTYNGIYRTRRELGFEFSETLLKHGFTLTSEGYAFTGRLRNRSETASYYFNFERRTL